MAARAKDSKVDKKKKRKFTKSMTLKVSPAKLGLKVEEGGEIIWMGTPASVAKAARQHILDTYTEDEG